MNTYEVKVNSATYETVMADSVAVMSGTLEFYTGNELITSYHSNSWVKFQKLELEKVETKKVSFEASEIQGASYDFPPCVRDSHDTSCDCYEFGDLNLQFSVNQDEIDFESLKALKKSKLKITIEKVEE